MIQHDQQSRWKAWMRVLAVDIRAVSLEYVATIAVAVHRRHETRCFLHRYAPVGGRPDLQPALNPSTPMSGH
jgi:hypothetical protein